MVPCPASCIHDSDEQVNNLLRILGDHPPGLRPLFGPFGRFWALGGFIPVKAVRRIKLDQRVHHPPVAAFANQALLFFDIPLLAAGLFSIFAAANRHCYQGAAWRA